MNQFSDMSRRQVVIGALGAAAAPMARAAGQQSTPLTLTLLSGEVTDQSVILLARIGDVQTEAGQPERREALSAPGEYRFRVSAPGQVPVTSPNLTFVEADDYTMRWRCEGLQPGTAYTYAVEQIGEDDPVIVSPVNAFRTLPGANSSNPVQFVMVSCANYEKFSGIGSTQTQAGASAAAPPASAEQIARGFPAFDAISRMKPDFFIGNGDNVYYDSPTEQPEIHALTVDAMRAKWRRHFATPSIREAMAAMPAFFLKDDHDYRYNDADRTDEPKAMPSHVDGVRVFREQLPIVAEVDGEEPTYRSRRLNEATELFFLEGRDYRDPNSTDDGPNKSLWGREQREWLINGLTKSSAQFLVLVSPTPMIGPDDASKRDNHANLGGFQHERRWFFDQLTEAGLTNRVIVINGDRHWQYHSIHPNGIEEFSCGAANSQNARFGRPPGDPRSTDPEAMLNQPYLQPQPVGGLLSITSEPFRGAPSLWIEFRSEDDQLLYGTRKYVA